MELSGCKLIGITGGIGSGKSVVSRILRLKGYGVYDCDHEARILMQSDCSLKKRLKQCAGENVYLPDGMLDRAAMSKLLFCNAEIRKNVNREVHAAVAVHLDRWISQREDMEMLFVESAILFTSGLWRKCDWVWQVTASPDLRVERIKKRNGWDVREISGRMASQSHEEDNLQIALKEEGIPLTEISNNRGSAVMERIGKLLSDCGTV